MSTSEDVKAKVAARLNGADPSPLRIVDPRIFQGKPVPERRWIVPDWVPAGVATALYGPGGTGKSLLAMQLMTGTALGRLWVGVQTTTVRSIGMFCEDDEEELHRRQAAINHQLYGCDFAALGEMRWLPRLGEDNLLMTFGRDGRGATTRLFDEIRTHALDFGAKLVVIDTIADTFGGNQNDAGQVRQYVQFGLARLARDIGGGVIACAHPSRAGINSGSGESGSVQWDAAFRSRLYLSAPPKDKEDDEPVDPDARVLTRKKANYAARDESIELYWHEGVLKSWSVTDGAEVLAAETVFLRLLDKMIIEGQVVSSNRRAGNYAPRIFTKRPERQGYRLADFERAIQTLFSMGEIRNEPYGKPSAGTQKITRVNAPPPAAYDDPDPPF